jgi:hypothetical protein
MHREKMANKHKVVAHCFITTTAAAANLLLMRATS